MTHEVVWKATTQDACTVEIKLTGEAFSGSKRDFWSAMDAALLAAEDVFCQDFTNRTGKSL